MSIHASHGAREPMLWHSCAVGAAGQEPRKQEGIPHHVDVLVLVVPHPGLPGVEAQHGEGAPGVLVEDVVVAVDVVRHLMG